MIILYYRDSFNVHIKIKCTGVLASRPPQMNLGIQPASDLGLSRTRMLLRKQGPLALAGGAYGWLPYKMGPVALKERRSVFNAV